MKTRVSLVFTVLIALGGIAGAQDGSGFSLTVEPAVMIPFPGTPSAARYTLGGQASVNADYVFPGIPFLLVGGGFDYMLAPSEVGFMNTIGLNAGAGFRLRILPTLSAVVYGRGGYTFGMLGEATAFNPYVKGGVDFTLYFSPSIRLSLGAEYVHQFALSEAQYQGIAARLSGGFNFSQMDQKSNVEIRDIIILPVYPVFYKYYNDNKVGSVKIKNNENGPIQNVRVTFYVKQYMDAPKECAVIPVIEQGKEVEVPLFALFNRSVLGILEPTKAQAEIEVTYKYVDSSRNHKTDGVASITHRNGMTWDDDRKVASFATVNDPAVMKFGKQVAGLARSSGWQTTDTNFRQALGVFESLGLYGIRYVVDPNTPFAEFEKKTDAVDYLQFPVQTLEFRAGDCDDLSILTCALLESVGIETAFITVPGHIYLAFALAMSPEQARSFFYRSEDLIEMNGKTWIPVEVTAVQDGFMRAWQLGAREWRDSSAKKQAAFYPTHEAWKLYAPVAVIGNESSVELPKTDKLLERYTAVMKAFVEKEIDQRAEKIKADMAASKTDPIPVNKLGVLYARYGVYDKAEENFRASLKRKETSAAQINLGNVLFLKKDFKGALAAYQSAMRLDPVSSKALEGLVRASYELDDKAGSARWLDQLKKVDKTASEKLAYTGSEGSAATRAGVSAEEDLTWSE